MLEVLDRFKLLGNKYDIVLMDHMMPVMDGIEATKAIRAIAEEALDNISFVKFENNEEAAAAIEASGGEQ